MKSGQRFVHVSLALGAAGLLAACPPSGQPLPFVEVQNGTATQMALLPGAGGTAVGSAEMPGLPDGFLSVRHNLGDRYSLFALPNDVTGPTPISTESAQLPAFPANVSETTVSLPTSSGQKWTSLRVYDRGTCTSNLSYSDLASLLQSNLFALFAASNSVSGARWTVADLTPALRAVPANSGIGADGHDIFSFSINLKASSIELCDNVNLNIDIVFEIERVPFDTLVTWLPSLVSACENQEDISSTYGSRKFTVGDIDRLCSAQSATSPDCLAAAAYRRITSGQQSLGDYVLGCGIGASVDGVRVGGAEYGELMSHFNTIDSDNVVIGFGHAPNGTSLNARDFLGRIVSVATTRGWSPTRCGASILGFLEGEVIADLTRKTIRLEVLTALPTAIRDAVRDSLALDGSLMGLQPSELVPCGTDADCNYLGSDHTPAYVDSSGEWRGARHVCRDMDPSRYALFGERAVNYVNIFGTPGRWCHVALEPTRLNITPNGVEIPLIDDQAVDPQRTFYSTSVVGGAICGSARSPGPAVVTEVSDQAPYEVRPPPP